MKTSSLFYGYGYFQCGIERIEASEILINSKEKGLIFLGITNHWMVLLTGFSEDFLLFDSRKNAGFLLGNSSIEEIGLFEEKERLSLGKKPMTIAEKRLFLNNIRDGDFLLKVLFEVKKGSFSLKSIYLNRVIFDILRSYEKQVNLRELEEYDYEAFSMKTQEFCFEIIEKKAENLKEKQEKFLDWAKNEKPPKVIREDLLEVLIKIGKEHLNKKTAIFLDNWMKEVEILYKTLEKDPIPQLLEVFKEIQDFFL